MSKPPIFVTSPLLPPLEDLTPYLEGIWSRKMLTNLGPLHQRLEVDLGQYLGVEHLSLFSSGTTALLVALKAFKIAGEVITTPFSFVATAHSLLWNGLTPVFADIDPDSLNLSPAAAAAAITPRTTAIMPVHCYGTPCDVEAFDRIAQRTGLKIIYDAAHAFAVECHCGQSVLTHGDASVLSFHATKVFNTFEGGAIVSRTREIKEKIDRLRNFGFSDEITIGEVGINGKMAEINAAMGLASLPYVRQAIESRRNVAQAYESILSKISGISLLVGQSSKGQLANRQNYSYYPILIEKEFPMTRDQLYDRLKQSGIFTRRYFFPLISSFPMYQHLPSASAGNLPVATDIARKILCLPISNSLTVGEAEDIAQMVGHIKGD